MSLRDAIASLADGGPFTVTRTAEGTTDDASVYTPGASSTLTIEALIQPITGRVLRDAPDAQRTDASIVIYTLVELRTRTKTTEPDVVTYDGEPWIVTKVHRYDAFGGTHYVVTASRTESP